MNITNCLSKDILLHGKSYDYKIVKVLGQGSFSITYLAAVQMRGELGSIDATVNVVIKEFFMYEINGREGSTVTSGSKKGVYEKYKGKFIKEAINLSKLHHRNIVRVIEAFEANNTVYYAMEYIDGGSLDDFIKMSGGLSETEAIKYAIQIGKALRFMHGMNILHLDLKPSNVMIREGEAVLIDFGLSKQYDDDGNPESSTTIGGGTVGYAPLEQTNYTDEKKDGLPVTMDIYAFGATLFKMLTGHTPPEASVILNDGFPESDLTAKGVSKRLSSNIAKCMEPLRKNRTQSLDVVLMSLKSIQNEPKRADLPSCNPIERPGVLYGPPVPRHFDSDYTEPPAPVYGSPVPRHFGSVIKRFLTWTHKLKCSSVDSCAKELHEKTYNDEPYVITPKASVINLWQNDIIEQSPEVRDSLRILKDLKIAKSKISSLFGVVTIEGIIVVDFRYDYIEPFTVTCLPGPGPGPLPDSDSWFVGAIFRSGNKVGYLRIYGNGHVAEYKSYSKEEYDWLRQLT